MTFTSPLKDTNVTEGDDVTLECETSKPGQKVEWFRDGKKIPKTDKRALPFVDGTKHKLVLKDAKLDDTAKYSAKVGDADTTAQLTVSGWFSYMSQFRTIYQFLYALSFLK